MSDLVSSSPAAVPEIQERFVLVDGCRVRYLTGGAGVPMVFAHGLLGYSFCFRHNLARLAGKATVYALDLPGTGFSERPVVVKGRLTALAKTLLSFVQQLGLRRSVLLGSSHGGAVVLMAACLAAQQGVALGPMILAAPVNPWSRNGRRRVWIAGTAAGGAVLRCIAPLFPALHGYFLGRMYGDASRLTKEAVDGYSRAIRVKGTMAHLLGRIAHWDEDLKILENALPSCAGLPTLLIWGERDRAVDPASAKELMRHFPKAELAVIRGAGHLPFEEEPDEFNRLVLDFVARQGASAYS